MVDWFQICTVVATVVTSAVIVTWRIFVKMDSVRQENNAKIDALKKEVSEHHLCTKTVEAKLIQQSHEGELFHEDVKQDVRAIKEETASISERLAKLEVKRKTRR